MRRGTPDQAHGIGRQTAIPSSTVPCRTRRAICRSKHHGGKMPPCSHRTPQAAAAIKTCCSGTDGRQSPVPSRQLQHPEHRYREIGLDAGSRRLALAPGTSHPPRPLLKQGRVKGDAMRRAESARPPRACCSGADSRQNPGPAASTPTPMPRDRLRFRQLPIRLDPGSKPRAIRPALLRQERNQRECRAKGKSRPPARQFQKQQTRKRSAEPRPPEASAETLDPSAPGKEDQRTPSGNKKELHT